jgi:hypothetical protein
MQILINLREVYGEVKAYPVCDTAKLFAQLAGTKTLTTQSLKLIAQLGYEVQCTPALTLENLK